MKRSTAVFIFLIGMIAGSGTLRLLEACHRPRRPQSAEIVANLSRDLALDETQRAKLADIFKLQDENFKAFQKEGMAKFDALREENDARIAAILTPVQNAKFQALREKWRQRRDREHDDGQGPPPPEPPSDRRDK